MIEFEMIGLRFERADPNDRFDLLLGVCADLTVRVDARVLYEEPDFPVAELAAQLVAWCRSGPSAHEDFEFASMESDETGLVWFRWTGEGYRVGSLYEDFPAMTTWSGKELRRVVEAFVTELHRRCAEDLRVDLAPLLNAD